MKINVPNCWEQITVSQFIELNTIDLSEYESISAVQLERLAIITDTSADDDVWDDMDIRELGKLIKQAFFLTKNPTSIYKKKLFDDTFVAKSFMELTLGEFVDIEYFLEEANILNIPKIAAILYRKYKIGEWGEQILEPYEIINLENRSELFLDLPITDIYGIVTSYIEFKTNFLKTYEALFEPDYDFDEEEEIIEDEVASFESEQEKIAEEKIKKWSWERLMFGLANNDIAKVDEISKLGLVYVFNMMSMKQELGMN